MAAGGSAPELFTSIIGVFVAESDVGFGTIVGSAVFNVLFVIGACSSILAYFFSDEEIYFYESLALLFLYTSYVVFMKYNEKIEQWVKDKMKLTYKQNER